MTLTTRSACVQTSGGGGNDGGAGLCVFLIGEGAAFAGMRFDQDFVAGFAQGRRAAGHEADARFVIFNFFRNADDHKVVIAPGAGGRPEVVRPSRSEPWIRGIGIGRQSRIAASFSAPDPSPISEAELILPVGAQVLVGLKLFSASAD